MKLNGKVALITGGGTGMGAAIAKRFVADGAKVCIAGRRKERLDQVADSLPQESVAVCPGDVSQYEDVLRMARVDPAPYGLFFSTFSPVEGGGNYGAMTMFDGRGYSLATYPLRTSVVYPADDPDVDYSGTWLLCHELQHSVDLVAYEKSGRTEMWHGDKPLDFADREGQQFSYQAGIFRSFDGYRDIKEPWGHLIETVGAGGGYICSPAHFLEPECPLANIDAFVEAVAELGTY